VDDQDDREYSRAPELEDLLALCKALNAEGVRYVLIGGFAVILHGFVRGTKDIDLTTKWKNTRSSELPTRSWST